MKKELLSFIFWLSDTVFLSYLYTQEIKFQTHQVAIIISFLGPICALILTTISVIKLLAPYNHRLLNISKLLL
ncbi:MAG: hypothetical protein HXS54_06030 [Theionarchaea archaeon]|nr:hypothetical protein [Theionarchaea archaeon]